MGQLTNIGYKKETFSEHLTNIEKRWKARLNDNEFTFDFNTPEGIHNEALTYEITNLDEQILELSNMFNIDGAKGIFLDYIQKLLPVEPRYTGKYASGLLYVIVDNPVTIMKDAIVKAGSLEFQVIADTDIDTVNKELYVRASETGTEYNIGEREINSIEGYTVNEIYNPYLFTNGEDLESDSDFRYRLKNSKNTASTATYEAITIALMELDVVNDVIILDPKTNPSTANGTVEIIIDGTPDRKIAEAIKDTLAAGIMTLEDAKLESKSEEFTIAGNITTKITYNILKFETLKIKVEVLEVNGVKDNRWTEPIQDELIKYVVSLKLGESILYNELHSEVNGIDEIRYAKVYVSLDDGVTYATYPLEYKFSISATRKFRLTKNDIEVIYV